MNKEEIAELAQRLDMMHLQRLFSKPTSDTYAASLYRCSVKDFRKAIDYRNNEIENRKIGYYEWVEACRCESRIMIFDYGVAKMETNPDANMYKNLMESLETPLSKIKFPEETNKDLDYDGIKSILGENADLFFEMLEKIETEKSK